VKIHVDMLLSSIILGGDAADFGVGVKAGTLGYGADFDITLTKTINARIRLTNLKTDPQAETITVGGFNN
jgi:hypothetical protein